MVVLLVFAVTLLAAVLVSDMAHRTLLSTAVVFHLIALVVAASIVAHSSTDVVVARWFRRAEPATV